MPVERVRVSLEVTRHLAAQLDLAPLGVALLMQKETQPTVRQDQAVGAAKAPQRVDAAAGSHERAEEKARLRSPTKPGSRSSIVSTLSVSSGLGTKTSAPPRPASGQMVAAAYPLGDRAQGTIDDWTWLFSQEFEQRRPHQRCE
jgi:hypothetical protein